MAGLGRRRGSSQRRAACCASLSLLLLQPGRNPGEPMVWRKSAGRGEEKIRQRPLLAAHRHHRDLLQPQSPYQAKRNCTASTHSAPRSRPSATSPTSKRDRVAKCEIQAPCPGWPGCSAQQCATRAAWTPMSKLPLSDKAARLSSSTPRECTKLPLIIVWMTPEHHAFR